MAEPFALPAKVGAVVVAAGRSARLGRDKLFLPLGGLPVLARTLAAFEACAEVDVVALVLSAANESTGRALVVEHGFRKVREVCLGGSRRQDSVLAGLQALADCDFVAVHDGARPLVTADLICRGIALARSAGAAIPGVPLKDTVKVVGPDGLVRGSPERAGLRAVQTPQVFRRTLLFEAYSRASGEVTDDAALVEALGHPVAVFEGSYENLKITTLDDLEVAEAILRQRLAAQRTAGEGGEASE